MLEKLRNIRIEEYNYPLPDKLIAQFPLEVRDKSKLLVLKDNKLSEDTFANIASHLPADSLLISNETRVVHARLIFQKSTGSHIEIFCLEPVEPTNDIHLAFQQKQSCTWKCLVGNARRWKSGSLSLGGEIDGTPVTLRASLVERTETAFFVSFSWEPQQLSFAQVLEYFGKIPLPPYISREASDNDNSRYQTVFARNDGSVAAPTAGLHFTPNVLANLAEKKIKTASVTLHVGAGTFKPVSSETIEHHHMHSEQVIVTLNLIKEILSFKGKHITLVGTTTVRTLESVYWQGVKWLRQEPQTPTLSIEQWDPYLNPTEEAVTTEMALQCVVNTLEKYNLTELHGETALLIAPGYTYHIPDAIITNFHQPRSTLLLLVAAFVGNNWITAYNHAMDNNFRFLSYGDSCLFFKHKLS